MISLFIITGCGDVNIDYDKEINDIDEITRYIIMKDDNGDEYKIYYYGVEDAIITLGEDNYDFEQAILSDALTLDEILNDMKLYAVLNDGGTKIYKDNGSRKYFSNSYTIIRCNTVDGNKDIYIGDSNMMMDEDFCKFKTTNAEIKLQEEVEKMKLTKKIIVRNMYDHKILKTITDEDNIEDIINMISNSIEMTLPVTSEGTNIIVQMFDDNDKLITFIYVWRSGYFGFEWGKDYFISSDDIEIFEDLLDI